MPIVAVLFLGAAPYRCATNLTAYGAVAEDAGSGSVTTRNTLDGRPLTNREVRLYEFHPDTPGVIRFVQNSYIGVSGSVTLTGLSPGYCYYLYAFLTVLDYEVYDGLISDRIFTCQENFSENIDIEL